MVPNPDITAREAFHFSFLERLFEISDSAQYVLKGGVNLRLFFGSPRYSEDMDLDVVAGSVDTLKKNGFKILSDKNFARKLQAFGVRELVVNDPAKAKQTGTTQRFRVRLITDAGVALPTKIEFSRRPPKSEYGAVRENVPGEHAQRYGRLGFPCPHYDGAAATLQKARALPGRQTPQCRDLFDLYILWLGGHAKRALIQAKLAAEERGAALSTIDSLDYEAYAGQVVEFLEDDARERFGSEKAWDDIRSQASRLFDG